MVFLLVGSVSIYFKAMFCYAQRCRHWILDLGSQLIKHMEVSIAMGIPPKWLVYEFYNGKSQSKMNENWGVTMGNPYLWKPPYDMCV